MDFTVWARASGATAKKTVNQTGSHENINEARMRNSYREQFNVQYPRSTMSKLRIFVSATIVLIFAGTLQAAPQPEIPEGNEPPTEEITRPPDENMSITPAPALDPATVPPGDAHYYPYRQQMTFRGGVASDFPKISLDDSVLGFEYLFPKFLSPKLEAGADLHENGRGHIHAGARWIYFERSYWRPSLQAGLDHYIDSKVGIATLARKEDWYVRGGLTEEYVVWNPYSLRLEQEMLVNFDNVRLVLTLGVSRGW
jgi:hypothetical protein